MFMGVVLGFLAVFAIDMEKVVLKESYHCTPTLSGLIKIAQILVLAA